MQQNLADRNSRNEKKSASSTLCFQAKLRRQQQHHMSRRHKQSSNEPRPTLAAAVYTTKPIERLQGGDQTVHPPARPRSTSTRQRAASTNRRMSSRRRQQRRPGKRPTSLGHRCLLTSPSFASNTRQSPSSPFVAPWSTRTPSAPTTIGVGGDDTTTVEADEPRTMSTPSSGEPQDSQSSSTTSEQDAQQSVTVTRLQSATPSEHEREPVGSVSASPPREEQNHSAAERRHVSERTASGYERETTSHRRLVRSRRPKSDKSTFISSTTQATKTESEKVWSLADAAKADNRRMAARECDRVDRWTCE